MTGRVLRSTGADTVPLPGAWVVLHGVTETGGAPVDSQRTDGLGRFRIAWAARDTGAAYVTSARYDGIAYFGEPFGPPAAASQDVGPIVVYDTSSTEPPVVLAERRVAVLRPEVDGSHRVVEYLRLANLGSRTRVSGGDDRPTWSGMISSEPREFETGPAEISGEAIAYSGGTVSVYAPIPPGERDLLISYMLPGGTRTLTIPVDQLTEDVGLLLEDERAVLSEGPLVDSGEQVLSGLTFRSFRGDAIPAGTRLVVRLPAGSGGRASMWLVWLVAAGALTVMGIVLATWLRRTGVQGPAPAPGSAETLAAQIAGLDAECAGREDDAYHARRAELKARLTSALARRRSTR